MAKKKPSVFALPAKGKKSGRFPLPDKAHARNALARAAQGLKRGTLSPEQAAKVRAKASRMLGK